MRPSHPPTLITLARRTIRDEALFARGDRVLVAVSGGPDSMALLHVLATLRRSVGHELVAHGVDHGLRVGAALELDRAEALATALGVPFARTKVAVSGGGNLQARARTARYTALRQAARDQGVAVIATAHHAEDRAETVLIRLLRGAGPRGLAVLAPREGDRVRPLIRAHRRDVLAHLARHGIAFADDPSNADPRFLRSRLRFEVLPLLQSLSPGIVSHLCALADQLGSDRAAEAPHMHTLPRAAREAIVKMSRTHSKKARVSLPGGLVATYDRAKVAVVVERAPTKGVRSNETAWSSNKPRKAL
jgi:tRNA(Ile)-lysidine synthase